MVHSIYAFCSFLLIFDFSTFLCLTRVFEGHSIISRHFSLRRLEPFDCAVVIFLKKEFIGLYDFLCYLHVASQSLTTLCCTLFRINSYSVHRQLYCNL